MQKITEKFEISWLDSQPGPADSRPRASPPCFWARRAGRSTFQKPGLRGTALADRPQSHAGRSLPKRKGAPAGTRCDASSQPALALGAGTRCWTCGRPRGPVTAEGKAAAKHRRGLADPAARGSRLHRLLPTRGTARSSRRYWLPCSQVPSLHFLCPFLASRAEPGGKFRAVVGPAPHPELKSPPSFLAPELPWPPLAACVFCALPPRTLPVLARLPDPSES